MRRIIFLFLVATVAVAIFTNFSAAATIYIKADGTGDYATIQDGVNAAVTGDVVLLAAGIYTGVGNRGVDLLGKAITVTSENGANVTIIDCQNYNLGFYCHLGEGSGSVISELTILNGNNPSGGGIACLNSSPTITGNTITGCTAQTGGGIFCNNSSPTITGNTITGNRATNSAGGGIFCNNSSPTITFNTITDNSASGFGGGIQCTSSSSPTITNNTISENEAPTGGGIYCYNASSPSIERTVIAFSTQGRGISCGGGCYPTISCSDIYGNAGGDALCGSNVGGNFSADPLFCGILGSGNYYLRSDSPCAPGNHPNSESCGLIGALPVACGAVPTELKTWGEIKAIYE